jgi:hypothetical protein
MPSDVYYALKPHNAGSIVRHVAMHPPQNVYVYFHAAIKDELERHTDQILDLREQLNAFGDETWFNYAANRKAALSIQILSICDQLDDAMTTIKESGKIVVSAFAQSKITTKNEEIDAVLMNVTYNAVQKAEASLGQTQRIRHQLYSTGVTTEAHYERLKSKRFTSPKAA